MTLRALGLGDLLVVLPALRGLRRAWPSQQHVLLAPAWLEPLVLRAGIADAVAACDHQHSRVERIRLVESRVRTGRGATRVTASAAAWVGRVPEVPPRIDVAVNLHGRGPHSHVALRRLRPSRLLAYRSLEAGHDDGPVWDPDEHEVRRWMRLLEHHGVPCSLDDLRLAVPPLPDAPQRTVVLHPGAASAARRWPACRWAAVAREVERRGATVVLTGSAGERDLCEHVAEAAGIDADRVLAGRTSVWALARWVRSAERVIAGDTGVGHLATATGTPSVLLFGPTPPARWGPLLDSERHRVLWHGAEGDPHGERLDPGLAAISVDEVLTAHDLLAA